MKRRYFAGISVLVLAGVFAALMLGGSAGAKSAGNGCPTLLKMHPNHGPVGTQVYFYGKGMEKVVSAWMKRKNDSPSDLYDARMTKFAHGDGFVTARVPSNAFPRIVDADIELDTANAFCFFPDFVFHIESESVK